MKKIILCLLVMFVAFSILGCGGNSDHAYKNAMKAEGEDVGDSAQIQAVLFDRQNWAVTSDKNKEFREYLAKLLQESDETKIQVNEAYYNFTKNTKNLTIDVDCLISDQHRTLKINCGQASVEMSSLVTANEWKVSVYNENNLINEYQKQADKNFRNPQIYSAKIKDNVVSIIFNSNIKIEK